MCIFQRHQPTWAGLRDHTQMNNRDEWRTLFRAVENNIHPYRMDCYWSKDDEGFQFRLMFTMFRLSLFDWQDI